MRELGKYGVAGVLKREVKKAGGMVEAFKSPGRSNVPDWLVTWPGAMDLVETKATGKKPRPGQVRDHKRRAKLGIAVQVLDTPDKVIRYVALRILRPKLQGDANDSHVCTAGRGIRDWLAGPKSVPVAK